MMASINLWSDGKILHGPEKTRGGGGRREREAVGEIERKIYLSFSSFCCIPKKIHKFRSSCLAHLFSGVNLKV
jgi:hypothetical protein